LSKEEYQAAVHAAALAAQLLAEHPLPKLLDSIGTADAVGPMFNPTLWLEKRDAMLQDKRLLEAALPLHKLGKEMKQNREDPNG